MQKVRCFIALSSNKFGSYNFRQVPQIKANIGQLYIKGFYKDRNGNIWILTFFNGICKNSNEHFTNYLTDTLLRFAVAPIEAKNIEYTIDIAPSIRNVKLSMAYRQHIYLILKEIINNLIKYSNCSKAYISVLYHNNHLEITVVDSGIGFDTKNIQYGNGIINMQQRAKQMNAVLLITSNKGAGTNIRIKIK